MAEFHEIRDAIHGFVRIDSTERRVLDSPPVQRLRHIHQLGLSHFIYPGANHTRLEHSLGVMELASRVFDVVTGHRTTENVTSHLPELENRDLVGYWRRVLRVAALCHDIGHLPFSHAAEKELLPEGWDHERLTRAFILSDEMCEIWRNTRPPLIPEDIVKLAVGARKATDLPFSSWEGILSDIIVGDAFGADRMDYLLRDSFHAGVAYGKFDHYRLVDTLRILPPPPTREGDGDEEPELGVEEGGAHSAEALLLARYFMYTQVYFHPVRRIYDIHLKDFLREWLNGAKFPTDPQHHLGTTDNEVASALMAASRNGPSRGHDTAKRIVNRAHFRRLYYRYPDDIKTNPAAVSLVSEAAKGEFGEENIRYDIAEDSGRAIDFPVRMRDGRVVSATAVSKVLNVLPVALEEYVFIAPDLLDDGETWLEATRAALIQPTAEAEE